MKRVAQNTAGFTLIEIMIVLALLALLAGISFPAFLRARENAQAGTCVGQLREIDQATQDWAIECKKAEHQTVEFSDIRPYLKRPVICPAGGKSFYDSYEITTVAERPTCRISPTGDHPHVLPGMSSDVILARPR